MNKDALETLKTTVEKNIKSIQAKIEQGKQPGMTDVDDLRNHHTLMRYAKLLMTIENRLASLPKKPAD